LLDAPVEPGLLEEMKSLKCWPPWFQADLDGDGRSDVVAVVTKGNGPSRAYGVIAIHAKQPQTVHWVVPLNEESITGLYVDEPRGAVVPLYCFDCDSNPFYRWSGTEYEAFLFQVGEEIALFVYDERNAVASVNLYADRNASSRIVASRELCTRVKVLERRGTSADRWYRVETTDHTHGWVPASSVTLTGCMGFIP
jgi:hypothetical protein